MANLIGFLLWRGKAARLDHQTCDLSSFDIIPFGYFVIFVVIGHYCFWLFCYSRCYLTLLLLVILLFPLWLDIIAFGYFVIPVVIWHYCFWLCFVISIVILVASFVIAYLIYSLQLQNESLRRSFFPAYYWPAYN